MIKILLPAILIVCFGWQLSAQSYEEALTISEQPGRFLFGIRHSVQPTDYIPGLEFGLYDIRPNLAVYISTDFRPFKKKIEERRGSNLYYQYAESRFILGFGFEYIKMLTAKDGFLINSSFGYSFGNYAGTDRKAQSGIVIVPRFAYVRQASQIVQLKVGYEYHDTFNELVSGHRLYAAIALRLKPIMF